MMTWPDQDEYPEADLPRPSASQLWRMWRAERKRADEIEEIGRDWMADSCAARRALDEAKAELLHAKSAMAEQIATLIRERDEARREVCLTWESVMGREAQTVAEDKGWDCFKEEP